MSCCACQNPTQIEPVIPTEEFIYCRPVITGGEIGATECSTQEHAFALPKVRNVLPQSCSIAISDQ